MTDLVSNNLVLLVVLGLVLFWLLLSALIGLFSGWYALASAYPDRPEGAVAKRAKLKATMGSATLNGLLRIDVCPSGLRLALNRIMVPLAHPLFVPWGDIEIRHKRAFMPLPKVILLLGRTRRKLTLAPEAVFALMRDSVGVWPEALLLPLETDHQFARRLFKQWLMATLIATVLLTVIPTLLIDLPGDQGLLALGLALPAATIGVNCVFTFFRFRSRR
jgi:hypothetical protein